MINREKLNKEKLKKYALSDEQLEQVSGGYDKRGLQYFDCPGNCGGACVNQCHVGICYYNYK